MVNQRRDWKSALQGYLNPLVSDAWFEYQSSPHLRKVWASTTHAYSEPGKKEQAEREAVSRPPDPNRFNNDLCIELGFLLCDGLFPSCHEDVPLSNASKSLLDALPVAFASVPCVSDPASPDAKRFLPTILEEYSTDVRGYKFFPTYLAVLLTAFSLPEAYLELE